MAVRADVAEHRIFVGESKVIEFLLTDDAGAPVNASGWALRWALTRHKMDQPLVEKLGGDITVGNGNGTGDLIGVTVEAQDTSGLAPGWYVHGLWRVDAGAEAVLAAGKIYLGRAP